MATSPSDCIASGSHQMHPGQHPVSGDESDEHRRGSPLDNGSFRGVTHDASSQALHSTATYAPLQTSAPVAWVPPPTGPPKKPKKGSDHPPRPPNAFILYRSEQIKILKEGGAPKKPQSDISKLIGGMWRSESVEVRRWFEHQAELKKLEHAETFPSTSSIVRELVADRPADYRYCPVRKPRRVAKPAPEDAPVAKAPSSRLKHAPMLLAPPMSSQLYDNRAFEPPTQMSRQSSTQSLGHPAGPHEGDSEAYFPSEVHPVVPDAWMQSQQPQQQRLTAANLERSGNFHRTIYGSRVEETQPWTNYSITGLDPTRPQPTTEIPPWTSNPIKKPQEQWYPSPPMQHEVLLQGQFQAQAQALPRRSLNLQADLNYRPPAPQSYFEPHPGSSSTVGAPYSPLTPSDPSWAVAPVIVGARDSLRYATGHTLASWANPREYEDLNYAPPPQEVHQQHQWIVSHVDK